MTSQLRVILEVGKKRRVVAGAMDWPGLDRWGDVGRRRDRSDGQRAAFSLRQPPARLFAMIALKIAVRAGPLMGSPSWIAIMRPVWLPWPPVMIPSGSGASPPSYRKTVTWSFAESSAATLPSRTKYGWTVRLIVSTISGSAAWTRSRTERQ